MTVRAYAEPNHLRNGVDLIVVDDQPDATVVLRTTVERVRVDPDTVLDVDDRLTVTEEEARALYEALAELYGHRPADGRQMRRDFEHERARADKLIDSIVRVAERRV